jgi:hypothetical protein
MFPIRNGWKKGNVLLPLIFKFIEVYAIRMFQVNQDGLKLNGTYQILVNADDVHILDRAKTIKENKEALVVASKEIGLEVNADKTHGHVFRSEWRTKYNIGIDNKSLKGWNNSNIMELLQRTKIYSGSN